MHKLGTALAFVTNKLFIILLIITTLVLAQAVAFTSVVTNKEKVKAILSKADVYTTLPNNIVYVIKMGVIEDKPMANKGVVEQKTLATILDENGFVSSRDFTRTITVVVTPEFLKQQTESVIDGTYNYLDGKTKEPLFAISLKDRAEVARKEIGALVNAKLASLPVCSVEQMGAQSAEINILEATCLPPGVSLQSEVDSFTNDLTGSEGIFAKEFTQKDISISDADAATARFVYGALQALPWIFWLLLFSFSMVIIVTAKTLHRGLKTAGIINIVTGTTLIIGYAMFVRSFNIVDAVILGEVNDIGKQQAQAITAIITPLYKAFIGQVSSQVIIICLGVIAVGIFSFVLGMFATKHHVEHLYLPRRDAIDSTKPEIDHQQINATTKIAESGYDAAANKNPKSST